MNLEHTEAEPADWFLQLLVRIVNTSDAEIGVTLSVGGILISGMLTGGSKYFDGFGVEFASAFRDQVDIAANFYSAISKCGDIYTQSPDSTMELAPAEFIHMKNAKFFHNSGAPIPSNRGILWRGRLSSVDGFSLGNLSSTS